MQLDSGKTAKLEFRAGSTYCSWTLNDRFDLAITTTTTATGRHQWFNAISQSLADVLTIYNDVAAADEKLVFNAKSSLSALGSDVNVEELMAKLPEENTQTETRILKTICRHAFRRARLANVAELSFRNTGQGIATDPLLKSATEDEFNRWVDVLYQRKSRLRGRLETADIGTDVQKGPDGEVVSCDEASL